MTDSRSKGVRGQGDLAEKLTGLGLSHSMIQGGRSQNEGDFVIENLYACECRRREKLSLTSWSEEHEAKTPHLYVPVIAYRVNRAPWRVSMRLEDWAALVVTSKALAGELIG